jgi:pimeloyl-ACP methyl ester carboxylesterase
VIGHRFVDAGGLRVHLAEAGEQDAPPVLLLHGWPQTSHLWRHVGPALAERGHRALMPDLRGFGQTQVTENGMDPETFAADQVALLDALGIERAGVVGHDWGGYAAFLLAARHPERISAVLACNAPHPWVRVTPRVAAETWRAWYAVVIASPLGPHLMQRTDIVRRALASDTRGAGFTEDDLDAFAGAYRAPERARAAQRLYRSYLGLVSNAARGAAAPVPELRVPGHLLFGTRDRAIGRPLIDGFPNVELVDAGHFVVDECPELVSRRAHELLTGSS